MINVLPCSRSTGEGRLITWYLCYRVITFYHVI